MEAISSIAPLLSGGAGTLAGSTPLWQKLLTLGAGGAGTVGNIMASNTRNAALNQELAVQKGLMNLTPEAMAAGAAKLEQPLSSGLTSSVGNAVQGYMAERGLSQAPGIQAEALSQGLAPYKLQEQQLAMNAFLQKLGLPAQAAARFLPTPGPIDLSKLFQSLFQRPDPSASTNGFNISSTSQLPVNLRTPDPSIDTTSNYNFGDLTPPDPNQFNMINYAMGTS